MALARDGHVEVVPLLDEEPTGYLFSHDVELSDTGYMFGNANLPSARHVELFVFRGISQNEDLIPSPTATNLRKLLGYFYAGGRIRVYRKYPSVLTAWDPSSNEFGYSDIVPESPGGQTLDWFAPMRSFGFELKGCAA